MKNLSISEGLFVEIEYVLSEAGPEGEVIEECPAEQAFGFTIGEGDVLPAFEKALEGKKSGEPFDFVIPCAEAYGEMTADAIVDVPRDIFELDGAFDNEVIKPGEVLPMSDDEGNEVYGIVLEVGESSVKMDFNHPFADLDLHFEGTICDVRESE
jgi:FKBP-type peptidyl-prolyl cis-trans isomerase SlyD